MPRPRSKQRPITDEVLRQEVLIMAQAGPLDWQQIPVGRMAEQASWLVGEGLMQVLTINGRTHLALIDEGMRES